MERFNNMIFRMKRLIFVFSILLIATVSCEKADCNGDLDGMWQLTSWTRLGNGQEVANKYSSIFWHFKLNLMKFEKKNTSFFYLARFQHKEDSLFIGEVHQTPFDSIVSLDSLASYGVEGKGRFKVEALDGKHMVLRDENNRLAFRKY